ncbi:MAG TPA: RpiB/LacA/LacB family sugar-phosphate isomerase, partial [Solirubrobacteraceae bacterium]
MRISLAADELTGIAAALVPELHRRGHETLLHGALSEGEREDWAWAAEAAARDVAEGRAEQGVVCCWTGTGASIAANKVPGVRAALCLDAVSAAGARRWNDANVLTLSLRATSEAELGEILDAWFAEQASEDSDDRANVERLAELDGRARRGVIPELAVDGGRAAIDFYKDAFGAQELYRVGGDAGHEPVVCQLAVGGASFWVADASPENRTFSPQALGGGTVRMLLLDADPGALVARAVAAGATLLAAVADEHGWRLGKIADPFGH